MPIMTLVSDLVAMIVGIIVIRNIRRGSHVGGFLAFLGGMGLILVAAFNAWQTVASIGH